MLKTLRKKGVAKKILWFIAVIIIISFGFLGQSYIIRQGSRISYAGKIFGHKVSLEEFQHNFELTQAQAIMQYGENFNKIKGNLNLVSQTWDRIILLHEAKRRKIPVTDQEVVEKVQTYPIFYRNKQFDGQLYHNILRYVLHLTPRQFEDGARDNVRFFKLFEKETQGVTVSDDDVFKTYQMKNEKVQVSYVLVESDKLKDRVVFDEAKAKEFYQSHPDLFLIPPTIKVQYLEFPFPEVKNPADLKESQKDEVFKHALDVSWDLNDNKNLEKTAQKFGLTIQETDFFSIDNPDAKLGWSYPVMQKILDMEKGIFSEPLETLKGYQIVSILEKKDAYIPDYEEAKGKVREAWINNETLKLSKQKAEETLKAIKEVSAGFKRPDFAKIAKDLGLELFQTPVFSRGEYLPKIGISRDFQEQAFALTPESPLSGVAETAKGYCILHLDSQIPVVKENFNKEKDTFTQALVHERKNAMFNEYITRLRLKASLQDHISKAMEKESDPGHLTRGQQSMPLASDE